MGQFLLPQGDRGEGSCSGLSEGFVHKAKLDWLRITLYRALILYRAERDPLEGYTSRSAVTARPIELRLPAVDELLIKGIRRDGSTFRPSDWAERLCGVAALLHSDAVAPSRAHPAARPCFEHSPHARPAIICGALCVIVDLCLRDLEPRAWDFVTGFARDNDLITLEVQSSCRGG
ncbi:MAG TPA: DUF3579 domain-containing protein [Nitrosospira sp.]|jgi:hypothetical protein|nr:DUF3579 domain-containing protein [Nitrosospira sp.]